MLSLYAQSVRENDCWGRERKVKAITVGDASDACSVPLHWAGAPAPQMLQVLANRSHLHSSEKKCLWLECHLGWRWLEGYTPTLGSGELPVASDMLESTWGKSYSRAS